jgi:membrane-bound lytic murein transglycosylase D
LRPAVWTGQRSIPAGYVVRLPGSASKWTSDQLAQRLGAAKPVVVAQVTPPASVPPAPTAATPAPAAAPAAATPPVVAASSAPPAAPATVAANMTANTTASEYTLVQNDDNVSTIAARTGVTVGKLMALNSIRDLNDDLYGGERLRLVAAAPEPETETTAANLDSAKAAVQESQEEDQAVAAAKEVAANTEPVSAAQAQAEGPQLLPGTTGPESADPVDYSVAGDGSIRVVAAETLGHYADWLGTSATRLRALNKLRGRTPVIMGRRIKLDFEHTTRPEFEQKRRDYHERLQAAYFASHRIAGTEIYVARRGDSLWSITQRNVKVPIWLLQQYNPDMDFTDLRPGTQVSLPKVEDVTAL